MATYYGTAGDDSIAGSSSPDIIYGYANGTFPENEFGNDVLRGGAGSDRIYGGGGSDTLMGDEGGDYLYGGDGNDTLIGGTGNDHYYGGNGNDTFVISDNLQDTYDGGTGFDTLKLGANINIQQLQLGPAVSVETINLNGFLLGGTSYGDRFDFSGLQSMDYRGTYVNLGDGNDIFTGHAGADYVRGGNGTDTLHGGGGNDVMSGGFGMDTFDGGAGNDTFLIDGRDSDTFSGGTGIDTVKLEGSTERYRLILDSAAGVERFDRAGFALKGTSVNDIFDFTGLSSMSDTGPIIDLGGGSDIYRGHAFSDRVAGGTGSDTLYGNAGSDYLDGGIGTDTLVGGIGNDTYVVDNARDRVVENGGAGTDLVRASVSHTLSAYVENLTLTGIGAINGAGNELANRITGNNAANTLSGNLGNDFLAGLAGNDRLVGGRGADQLQGGIGKDTFVFTHLLDSTLVASGQDTILDFGYGDRMDLSALDANTRLSGNNAFHFIGKSAFTGSAGELRYQVSGADLYVYGDVNGDGRADFGIHLKGHAALYASDFLL